MMEYHIGVVRYRCFLLLVCIANPWWTVSW
jgi:hypothetical protein